MKRPCVLPILLLAAVLTAQAAGAERQQLERQRAEVEARHRAALADCAARFDVNSCRDQARRARADALKPVQAREQELDAEERQARAGRQRERVRQKQEAFAEQEGQRQSETLLAPTPPAPPASAGRPARVHDEAAHARAVQAEIARGEQEAARRRTEAAQRQQRAQTHREAALRRQQARAASAPASGSRPVVSLPQPTAAELAGLPDAASRPGR